MIRYILPLFLLLSIYSAYAGRPLIVDETGTADRGAFELELGIESDVQDFGGATVSAVGIFGVLECLEASVEGGFSIKQREVNALVISAKFAPDFARYGPLSFGIAAGGDVIGKSTDLLLISTVELSGVSADWNTGMSFDSDLNGQTVLTGAAMRLPLSKAHCFIGEVLYSRNVACDTNDWWAALGIRYGILPRLTLDCALGLSINDKKTGVTATTGITSEIFWWNG